MKKSSRIITWAILFMVAATGLILFAVCPELAMFTVPLWKWFLTLLLAYWIIRWLVFGRTLALKLSVVLPLALLFLLFEPEIGTLLGRGEDFVKNWIVMVAAGLLVAAFFMLFNRVRFGSADQNNSGWCSGTTRTCGVSSSSRVEEGNTVYTEDGGERICRKFRMGDHTMYVDADRQRDASFTNQMGELNVYYQNTDVGDLSRPLKLEIVNQMGETNVHIPANWRVVCDPDSVLGQVNIRPDAEITIRDFNLTVKNQLGEVNIR